jgi:hypothetical protein
MFHTLCITVARNSPVIFSLPCGCGFKGPENLSLRFARDCLSIWRDHDPDQYLWGGYKQASGERNFGKGNVTVSECQKRDNMSQVDRFGHLLRRAFEFALSSDCYFYRRVNL